MPSNERFSTRGKSRTASFVSLRPIPKTSTLRCQTSSSHVSFKYATIASKAPLTLLARKQRIVGVWRHTINTAARAGRKWICSVTSGFSRHTTKR